MRAIKPFARFLAMVLRVLAALVVAAVLNPNTALAAASGQPVTPVNMSVEGGETKVFSARFMNGNGMPAAGETVTWGNDVCGTFPNAASLATSVTDATGLATIAFTAAPSAGITCWLTAVAGPAAVTFNVVTYRMSQVSIVVEDVGVFFDPNGSNELRASVRLGQTPLREVEVSGRIVPGAAPVAELLPVAPASTGQSGHVTYQLRPPIGAVGDYELEFAFRGLTKRTTIHRGARNAAVRSISGPSPGGGTQTLALSSTTESCTFTPSSDILNPAVTEFLPDFRPARGLAYTEGILSIRTENCGIDRPVTFTLTTPRPVPAGSLFWMLSGTAAKPQRHWHPIPVVANGNTISFTLTDGSTDEDRASDGAIKAFGGFAVAPPWYYELQDLWWGGVGENGWGVSIVQHDETLFAVIFAYDANGMPTWYVMSGGQWNAARTAFTGALYSPRGAPYTAYDASQLDVGPAVGTLTLTFVDASHANLDYVINGMAGQKQITRQLFGAPASGSRPALGDMWWGGGQQNGWGIAVLQQYGALFAVWFTYSEAGNPTWFVMPAGTWTATDTYEGRIYRTASSRWLAMSYNATSFRVSDVGSFRIRFTGTATFEWTIDGRSGTMPLTRQPF
jgi:hypothetical protein